MKADLDQSAVSTRIRELRAERGLSQMQLGGEHYTAAYISHLEHGKRRPSPKALAYFAERLGVTADFLATGLDPGVELRLHLDVDRAIAELHSGGRDAAEAKLERIRRRARRTHYRRAEAGALEGLGMIAQRRGEWDEAMGLFGQAEALLADQPPETRPSLVTGRARCLFASNHINHAIHVLETHLIELEQPGPADPTALLQTYSALIGPCFEAGFRDRAATLAEQAHQLETRVQDPEHVACLNINRAQILLEQGHSAEAMRCLARAEDLFKQIGWRDSATKAAVALATAAIENGDLDTGKRHAKAALEELEHTPSALDRARALNMLARIERLSGKPLDALAYLDQASRELGDERSIEQGWRLREVGLCHMDLGDHERAEGPLREALTMYRQAHAPSQVATTSAYLGDVLSRLGRPEEAAKVYREGLAAVEDLAG